MKTTIKLTGIKASGKHGANPGEQDSPQNLLIDVEIELDVSSDGLDGTVDYDNVTKLVRRHVSDNSYKLIETMAYNIASEVRKLDRIYKVLVVVHKPLAAKTLDIEDVSARAMI